MFWHCNINIQWNRKYQTWWIDKFKFFPYFHAIWKLLNLKLEKFLISSSEKKEKRKPWRFQIDPTRISLFCINLPRSFIENYEEYAFTRNTSNASYRRKMKISSNARKKKRKNCIKLYWMTLLGQEFNRRREKETSVLLGYHWKNANYH